MRSNTEAVFNDPLLASCVAQFRAALAAFAREHLPEPMVPTRYVILRDLPKLPNGKVDRNRLPTEPPQESDDGAYVPPTTPEEQQLAQIWEDVLGVARVGLRDSFFGLGGDSLAAAQMAARVRERFGRAPSLRRLLECSSLQEAARLLGPGEAKDPQRKGNTRSLDSDRLAAEAVLPEDVLPDPAADREASAPYRSILLTGATGYTGAFLLRELFQRSQAQIYVLVRARDEDDALARVQNNMQTYGLWRDEYRRRLVGIPGDLGRPYFGVNRQAYEGLANTVEMIIHNGASSNYALPYDRLKPVNVLGTLEVLRLACRRRIKPVHFVSSLAVFPGDPGKHLYSEIALEDPGGVVGGYRQSKWVADRLVTLAGERGLPVCVYRPGLIAGAQDTGACSTDTFVNAIMKGCIQLGLSFDFDVMLEMVPVDFCAASLVHIALLGHHHGAIYHQPSPRTVGWNDLTQMLRIYGYDIRNVPYAQWHAALTEAADRGDDNELVRFLPLFGETAPAADLGYPESEPTFANDQLMNAIRGTGIVCRRFDQELLNVYLDYFVATGYLERPSSICDGPASKM